jgi:hypothetical protein
MRHLADGYIEAYNAGDIGTVAVRHIMANEAFLAFTAGGVDGPPIGAVGAIPVNEGHGICAEQQSAGSDARAGNPPLSTCRRATDEAITAEGP